MTTVDGLVAHYLAKSMVMRLATLSRRGAPSLTPIWFVVVGGRLIASTAAATVAARNIAVDSRVSVLLDAEAAGTSDFVMRLHGRAEVHPGLPPVGALARMALKYYVSPRGVRTELAHAQQWRLRGRYYASAEAVWLAIEPTDADLVRVPDGAR